MTDATPFALGTFATADGRVLAGLVVDGAVLDLGEHLGPGVSLRSLLEDWDRRLPDLQRLADGRSGRRTPLGDLRPLAPVQPPGQVFQAGANYRKHVLSLLMAADRRGDASDGLSPAARAQALAAVDERAGTGKPFVFLGSSHAMVGPMDDVVLPRRGLQHDWELELAAVIGRRARNVRREDAGAVVAGYTICNDITTRDALRRADSSIFGLDWLAAKNAPTFLPTGPVLVPSVHVPDPMRLRIELRVNGVVMQDESTSDMLFGIERLVEHISSSAELRPGDFVLTGSPAGNGAAHGLFLQPGDVVEGAITGLGLQRNRCVAEGEPALAAAAGGAAATDARMGARA